MLMLRFLAYQINAATKRVRRRKFYREVPAAERDGMEICGRWLLSGAPNCERDVPRQVSGCAFALSSCNTSLSAGGNTAVTRLERTSPSVWVCVCTKLVEYLAKCSQQAAMGPPVIAEGVV